MSLFQYGDFTGAAGLPLKWKIECDILTALDWETIAKVSASSLPQFGRVFHVPTGGLKLRNAMRGFGRTDLLSPPSLLVDDVWTTGASMRAAAEKYKLGSPGRDWFGFVAFARGPIPIWCRAFMKLGV